MSEIVMPYDDASWPQYKNIIVDHINKYYKDLVDKNWGNSIQESIDECETARHKYRKEFRWALYITICICLPFSVLTIVPAYWCIKQFKKMKSEHDILKADFVAKKGKRTDNVREVVNSINFTDCINNGLKLINYEHKGPLSNFVLSKIFEYNNQSYRDLFKNSNTINSWKSSWGLLDKHMLIINVAYAKHWMTQKDYSKTESYPYEEKNSEGKIVTSHEYLTAHYQSPVPEYSYNNDTNVVSLRAPHLNFYPHFGTKAKRVNEKSYAPLENKMFNKEFAFARNDEAAFRILFTADVQEYLVNKLSTVKNKGERMLPHHHWIKNGILIGSHKNHINSTFAHKTGNFSFIYDVNLSLKNVCDKCTKFMLEIIYNWFLSLNCATSIPAVITEYNNELIESLGITPGSQSNTSRKSFVYDDDFITISNDVIYAQSVLANLWNDKAVHAKTDIMYTLGESKVFALEDCKSAIVSFKAWGNSYDPVPSIAPVPVEGKYTGPHIIEVPYIEYVPVSVPFRLCYAPIKSSTFYSLGRCDNKEVQKIINKYNMSECVKIRDHHIVGILKDKLLFPKFMELVREISLLINSQV